MDKDCIIVDDIVDSATTLCTAAQTLKQKGAHSVSAYISHGVFSGHATQKISNSQLKTLVITDSIKNQKALQSSPNIRLVSIAPLLAEAIRRISLEESVSHLFDYPGCLPEKGAL